MDASGQNFASPTGIQLIDAALFGTRWNSNALTFTFPVSGSYYNTTYEDYPGHVGTQPAGFSAVTPELASAFRWALSQISTFCNLTFTEVGSGQSADLTAARTTNESTASGRFPTWSNEGDVWFNTTNYNTPTRGNYAFHTVMHEIGHTLGLKHGHASDHGLTLQALPSDRDSMEFSVMTYRNYIGGQTTGYTSESYGYAQSYMMSDIAALQTLYGVNYNYQSGNTNYTFSETTGQMFINGVGQLAPGGNRIFLTIWDGGGVDTYDLSNYSTNLRIDLAPGGWSRFSDVQIANLGNGNYARANVYNALQIGSNTESLIDNAIGGSGNDQIYGNAIDNMLSGSAGEDILVGQGGNDVLIGGSGNDQIYGDFRSYSMSVGLGSGYQTLPTNAANISAQTAINFDNTFSFAADADISNATSQPHSTVNWTTAPGTTGSVRAHWYSVTLQVGQTLFADIDHTVALDSYIRIMAANGSTLIAFNDDSGSDAGSSSSLDSFLSYTPTTAGLYYIVVGQYGNVETLPANASYELNISVTMGDEPAATGSSGADSLDGGAGNDVLIGDGVVSWTNNAQSVQRLYLACFRRIADDSGQTSWTNALDNNTTALSVATGFVNSAEFQQTYGSLTNTQYVTLLYQNVLNRSPDAGGLSSWVGQLDGGASRAQVLLGFSESAEFQIATNITNFAGQIYRLYDTAFNRAADTGGFTSWVDARTSGMALSTVVNGFMASQEFTNTYGALDTTQFVTLLYQNVLNRAPDSGGLSHWIGQLNGNTMTRAEVLIAFSEGQEHVNLMASSLDSFMDTATGFHRDTLAGGSGTNSLTGGRGADTFVFNNADNGTTSVYGFEVFDTLRFVGFGFTNASQALAAMTQQGANVVFASQGDTITFHNTQLATLQAMQTADWVFV